MGYDGANAKAHGVTRLVFAFWKDGILARAYDRPTFRPGPGRLPYTESRPKSGII